MKQRGRKSAEAVILESMREVIATARLMPPKHITDAERMVWLELVSDHPADTFRATHAPLIEMYCRHVVQSRILAEEIALFERAWLADDAGLRRYDRLLAMAEREARAASSLATRLRVTRQATTDSRVAHREHERGGAKARKPWELPAPEGE